MKAELRTLLVSRTGDDVFICFFCLQFDLFSMNRKVMKFESQQLVSRTGEDAGRTFLSFDFHCRRQSLRHGPVLSIQPRLLFVEVELLFSVAWEQGCEGAGQARGSRWQMRKQTRKRRDRPLSSFADVLGRLFPGSALSEGTTGSENSGAELLSQPSPRPPLPRELCES